MSDSPPVKFCLKTEMYPVKFMFWFGEFDAVAIGKYARRCGVMSRLKPEVVEEPPGSNAGFVWDSDNGFILISKKLPFTANDFDTLFHELQHALLRSGRFLGFVESEDSEEYYTYMQGFLAGKLYRRFWRPKE